jgi:hypothetical protein
MAEFARHNLLCGFAALRDLIFQTVHSHTIAPQKKGLTPSRKGAKKRSACREMNGREAEEGRPVPFLVM